MPHHRQVRGRHCVTEQNEALLLKMRQCFLCCAAKGSLLFPAGSLSFTDMSEDYSWPASFL